MNRLALLSALKTMHPFLSQNDFIPMLTHFCFVGGEKIVAYNDVQAMVLPFKTPLDCAVPGSLLLKCLNTLKSDEIDLSLKGTDLTVISGKTKIEFKVLSPDQFIFESPEYENTPILMSVGCLEGMKKCLLSVGTSPTHQKMNGITIVIEEDKVSMYSTDAVAISRYTFYERTDVKNGDTVTLILPTFFCQQLINLATEFCKDGDYIKLKYEQNKSIVAEVGEEGSVFKIYSRLIDAVPLDFEATIEKSIGDLDEIELQPLPEMLQAAFERAQLLIGNEERHAKSTTLQVRDEEIRLTTESSIGTVKDYIDLPNKLGNFDAHLVPDKLLRVYPVVSKISFRKNLVLATGSDGAFLHLISYVTAA